MRLYKTEGIVLKSKAFGEADTIVTLLSKNHGKLQLIANGARKIKSKKRGSVQPYSYSEFLINQGKSLDTIAQGDIIESFSHLKENLELLVLASYCCELVDSFLPDKEPSLEVFHLLLTGLYQLPFLDREVLIRAFELKLLSLAGYAPQLTTCARCNQVAALKNYFSSSEGGMLCQQCRNIDSFSITCSKGILSIMERLLKSEFQKLKVLKLNQEEKVVLKKINESYLRYVLEKNLKSWTFIKALNINSDF